MIEFEWDVGKAASNERKHGVSFEEAKSVFYDEHAVQFYDGESSELGEDRFLMLGLSNEARLLLVCHCERGAGEVIRIISARKATRETLMYSHGLCGSLKRPYARRASQDVAVAPIKKRNAVRWALQAPPCGAKGLSRSPRCLVSTGGRHAFAKAP